MDTETLMAVWMVGSFVLGCVVFWRSL